MLILIGPKAKAARAKRHLDELDRALDEFYALQPYRIVEDHDSQPGQHLYRLKIDHPPPVELGLIVGDFANCLRSALDHLAWELALSTNPTPYKRTEFPIFKDREEFADAGRRKVRDLPPAAQEEIEKLQPYQKGTEVEGDPLWVLHGCCNIDKHRTIIGRFNSYKLPVTMDASLVGTFEDGDVIGTALGVDEGVEPQITLKVAFDIGAGRLVGIEDLRDLHEYIASSVIPRFARFFP